MEKYGIIAWYFKQQGMDFDRFKDKDTRDKIKESSSEEFFDEIMDYAKGKAETDKKAEVMESLKTSSKFAGVSISQIRENNDFDVKANEHFNNILNTDVDRTELPDFRKDRLVREIPDYNDRTNFSSTISNEIETWKRELEKEKEEFKRVAEEYERVKGVERARITRTLKKEAEDIEEVGVSKDIEKELERAKELSKQEKDLNIDYRKLRFK